MGNKLLYLCLVVVYLLRSESVREGTDPVHSWGNFQWEYDWLNDVTTNFFNGKNFPDSASCWKMFISFHNEENSLLILQDALWARVCMHAESGTESCATLEVKKKKKEVSKLFSVEQIAPAAHPAIIPHGAAVFNTHSNNPRLVFFWHTPQLYLSFLSFISFLSTGWGWKESHHPPSSSIHLLSQNKSPLPEELSVQRGIMSVITKLQRSDKLRPGAPRVWETDEEQNQRREGEVGCLFVWVDDCL